MSDCLGTKSQKRKHFDFINKLGPNYWDNSHCMMKNTIISSRMEGVGAYPPTAKLVTFVLVSK